MATIYLKIYEYNEDNNGIIVGFASSETNSQNPDDYGRYNYDLKYLFTDCKTVEQLRDNLAKTGISICDDIKKQEQLTANTTQIDIYKTMVGQTYEVDGTALTAGDADVSYGAEVEV